MNRYELENLHTEYLEKIENLVKEHYEKTHNYQPCVGITLTSGKYSGECFAFHEALVPVDGYTHIAKVHSDNGHVWMYARELTAEEKERAPEGCGWDVDNTYAKFDRYCNE